MLRTSLLALATLLASPLATAAEPLNLLLPTDNDAILKAKPEEFYMYTYRSFEGKSTKPWQAGTYGFVHNMKRVPEGVIGTRFHEGVDIRPVKRDSSGRPRDEVRTIATGVVAYVNSSPGGSNYGKYVVVEHNWGYGPVFSLYAHLATVDVEKGQRVLAGGKLGRMGYTGAGINRERAHVHLELDLLLSLRFDDWHKEVMGASNPHGIHNGLNLSGMDYPTLLVALQKNPDLTIPAYLKTVPVYYKVTIPRRGPLEISERYPWMKIGDHSRPSPSWELSFSSSGLPVGVAPSQRSVPKPLVTFVRTTQSRHEYYTLSRLSGTGRRATLTSSGQRYIKLVTGEFPTPSRRNNPLNNNIMSAEQRLADLGLELPEVPAPVASYVNCVRTGNLLYLSGGLPVVDGAIITGQVPRDISAEDATAAARNIILNRLSVVRNEIGSLDKVVRIVNLQSFVNSAADFYDHPKVVNGASDLLLEIFGEAGKHSRIALGAAALPLNAAVEISLVVEVQ